ncbi:MAG: hypothetical protein PHW69_01860 [Elusimicrobiaceae bacterium]|nr:hypothetical protein [Elusimicrobiaceae bacterium]
MRTNFRVVLLGAVILSGYGGPVRAAIPVEMAIISGPGVPVGGYWSGHYGTSYYLGSEIETYWTERFATGGALGYFFNHSDGQALKREFKNLHITPYLKRIWKPDAKHNVYALLGGGIYFVNYDDDAATPDIDDSTKRYFGLMGGIGASRHFGVWSVGLDIRVHRIFRQQYNITTLTPAAHIALDL